MNRRFKIFFAGAATAALAAAAGTGIAAAGGAKDDGETEVAITGSALQKASAAALEHTGGGSVTQTEVDDEESYYEVEVTREDGSQVDVQLDRDFRVVGDESEGNDAEDGR
ncbi:hypothetical protein BH20ACT22_BH20ACT22_05720 [soil metagenome]